MTTPTQRVRLSPSGKTIGNPPLQVGPGSIGRMWRKHGVGTPEAFVTSPVAIGGLAAIPVDIKPGYLYDLEVNYVVDALGTTATATNWSTYYRLRTAAGVWGSWVTMINGVHTIRGETADLVSSGVQSFEGDAMFGVSSTVTCTAVEFALQAGAADASVVVFPFASWARICEYMP